MNVGELSIKNNQVVFAAVLLIVGGGIVAYLNLGRLEDPEFTIKEALIVTPYPGASAEEVAQEVTNPIESACQQLGQLKSCRVGVCAWQVGSHCSHPGSIW